VSAGCSTSWRGSTSRSRLTGRSEWDRDS
jgi:hypothetical protein